MNTTSYDTSRSGFTWNGMATHPCPHCGKNVGATANFCQYCGEAQKVKATSTSISKKASSKRTHPWRRYFARMIDLFLVSFVFGLLAAGISPTLIDETHVLLLGMLLGLLIVVYDMYFLSQWGTTLGKWLLGMTVKTAKGQCMTTKVAFTRGWLVFLRGLGLGIPVVSLVTMLHQYSVLRKKGVTSWDKELDIAITYHKLQPWKVSVAVLCLSFFVSVALTGGTAG